MKVFKFLVSFVITLGLIYMLDNSWMLNGKRLPPLGKFLDPFHGFWQNMDAGDQTQEGDLDMAGLKNKVTVVFDSLEIPHIFAGNDEDLYFAQGYITAKHRLWQMEIQTRAAAGRLTEVLGEPLLDFDRSMRRLGMVHGAQYAHDRMMKDPTSRMIVESYTAGINAYIESVSDRDLPFEYKLLDYKPEPWTTLKCALVLMNMNEKLSMSDKDMEMSNALKVYGREVVDLLYPDREIDNDPVVDKPGIWKFNAVKLDTIPLAVPEEFLKTKKAVVPHPDNGSNNWAVSGSKTITGSPILCGDPHLTLSLPSIWYGLQLHAPGINCMGTSLPGAPGIIIGFTDSIAWSITNAQRDLVDWFKITYQDKSKTKYQLDGKWADTKKVVEEFHIRDKQEVFYDTVTYTHWGPVAYDQTYHAEKNLKDYAFRWMAHTPQDELFALYKLNRAKNCNDYMEALNYFGAPAQNFAFASTQGDIAMRVQGKYPVRRMLEGKFVLDGSKSSQGWQAIIPNEQNVTDKNPSRGFVSSANQYPADATYPYYIQAASFENYRNRRINQVLRTSDSITVHDMMLLQNDNYNMKAAESLPFFLAKLDSAKMSKEELQGYQILKAWDYRNEKDAEGASYFEAWFDNVVAIAWDDLRKKDYVMAYPSDYVTFKLLRDYPSLSLFDAGNTTEKETATEVIQKAFTFAIEDIEEWKKEHSDKVFWADYKDSYIANLLKLEPLGMHIRTSGSGDDVNAMSRTHGPSWRMIVSLEKKGVKAWAVYPGGQSGNPGNTHYNDMVQLWNAGQYVSLIFATKPEDIKHAVTLNLNANEK